MKKVISTLLCLSIIFAFVGCSKSEDTNTQPNTTQEEISQTVETILTPAEYVLYQNVFYNEQAGDYVYKEVTKHGIFTVLYDEYNSVTRYYVWGYNDNTKCCDWQWEIVPNDTSNLPNAGSTIDVTGTFTENENALDGYWIENAKIDITAKYKGSDIDVDTTTMGGTLERVQVANMQAHPDKFEGKTVTVYGRILSATTVQHPYYDNCFSQEFVSNDDVQAIGTRVVISGTYTNGVIEDAEVNTSVDF
ncbi:MAG: hypothetical protein ACI4HZ_07315 [Ruminococcus sp.]